MNGKQLRPPKIYTVLLLICLSVSLIQKIQAQNVKTQKFYVLFPNGASLGFQNADNATVELLVTSGALNSTKNTLLMDSTGGTFKFTAHNDTTIKITYTEATIDNVKVGGDQNKDFRMVNTGASFTVDKGNTVTVLWDIPYVEFLLPLLFILGMVGLTGMFGGSLYAVNQIKNGKYREGFINGVIWVSIGAALVLAWLW